MSMDSGRKDACTFPLKMGKTLVTGSSTWRRWHLWGKSQSPPSVSLHEHSVSKSKEHHCTYDFACDEGSVHGLTHLSQAPTYNVHGRKEDTTIFRHHLLYVSLHLHRRRLDALSGMAQTASFQPKGMDTAKPLGKAKKMKDTHTLLNNTIAHTMEHMSSFRQVLDKDTPKGTWAMRDCLIP